MVPAITFSVYLALPNLLGVKAGKPAPPQHKGRGGSASFDTHPAASCFATMCVMETDQSSPSEPVATVKHTEALFRVSARVIRGLKLDVWLGGDMCEYQHLQGADPQHLLWSSDMRMINDAAWIFEKQGWKMEAGLLQAHKPLPDVENWIKH